MRIGNCLIKAILASRLHGILSKNTLIIEFEGIKSGKTYALPVNYVQVGKTVLIISMRSRIWWRNLSSTSDVVLTLRGSRVAARATSYSDAEQVVTMLETYLQAAPHQARYFEVGTKAGGAFSNEDLARASGKRIIIAAVLTE
ncbi:MAG: hypothetical protein JXA97_06430 [Anaerolineales bacterium]|nr:hypothetical protein [Anaerolineales bacterium]